MSADVGNDPVLSLDFAERVLARADVLVARQRRIRRIGGGIVAAGFVSVAVISWTAVSGMMQSPARHSGSAVIVASDSTELAQADDNDALSDLFPDAAPVARFATEYSAAADDTDTALFSDQDPIS